MSYDISVYSNKVEEKTVAEGLDFDAVLEYIEKEENLVPFSSEQVQLIEEHLVKRGYVLKRKSKGRKDYEHEKYKSASAMLLTNGLFFNARGEDVMEISMTAGEFSYYFSLKGNFSVLDTHNGGWQK